MVTTDHKNYRAIVATYSRVTCMGSDYTYYGPNWNEIRKEVIDDDGGQCVLCFSRDNLVVHHRKPINEFDSHAPANAKKNLATLCKRCHRRIESIQNPHTRRGMRHFLEELLAEGEDVPESMIEFLCYKTPKSNAPNAECCSADGCFYPIKQFDLQCPKCGDDTQYWKEISPEPQTEGEGDLYKCSKCGQMDRFTRRPLNQHGCPSPGGHHNFVEAKSKNPSDVGSWICTCGYETLGERAEPPLNHFHDCDQNPDDMEFVEQ